MNPLTTARYGRALRDVAADGPGLLTVRRIQQLYAAGRMTAAALERSLAIAVRRRPRAELGLLSNDQIDRLPEAD